MKQHVENKSIIGEGIVTKNGIACLCGCVDLFSLISFKTHVVCASNMNLFMESGKPLSLCQLEACNKEYSNQKVSLETSQAFQTGQIDEICGLCGDYGELICCDDCPSAFHQTCLREQVLPERNWYCVPCRCRKYHKTCTNGEETNTGHNSVSWFCSQSCLKAYSELESRIGLTNDLPNELSCSLLRCIDEDDKMHSSPHFVGQKAECKVKLSLVIRLMEENFLDEYNYRKIWEYFGNKILTGKKECSYYMKAGECKFGVTCKFHHPEPIGVQMPPQVSQLIPQQPCIESSPLVQRPTILPRPVILAHGVVPVPGWTPFPITNFSFELGGVLYNGVGEG